MLICELCDSDDKPNYGVSFDFAKGKYCCSACHSGVKGKTVGHIRRKLVNMQITEAQEKHLFDDTPSRDDPSEHIRKSDGRPWVWQG